jgi:hypothetical protein
LFSDGIRPFAVSLLGCECVVVRHTPWYSWWMIPHLTATDVHCWIPLCLGGSGWETDAFSLQLLPMHSYHSKHTQNECLHILCLWPVYSLSLTTCALLLMKTTHRTSSLLFMTTEHKLPTKWYPGGTHDMGESTFSALVGVLCWN